MSDNINPIISIIVPVYNVEKYISDCVQSVLGQSFPNFELILVDDGSKDNSGKICDSFAAQDKRITVIHKKNQGVSSARNDGIEISKGKYITFLDSDDMLCEHFLQEGIKACEKGNLELFCCGHIIIGGNDEKEYIRIEKPIRTNNRLLSASEKTELLKCIYTASPWGKIFKREIIGDIRFTDTMCFGEDTKFVLSVIRNAKNIEAVPEQMYIYRRNPSGLCSEASINKCKSIKTLYRFLLDENDTLAESVETEYVAFIKKRMYEDFRNTVYDITHSKINTIMMFLMLRTLFSDEMVTSAVNEIDQNSFHINQIMQNVTKKRLKRFYRRIREALHRFP